MRRVIGTKQRFDYPREFTTLPEYTAHAGQIVEVIGKLPNSQVDPENRPMFRIRAADGWEGEAFGNELEPFNLP